MSNEATIGSRPRRKLWRGLGYAGLSVIAVAGVFLFVTPQGKDIRNLWSNGTIQAIVFKPADRTYTAGGEKNLQEIRTGLMMYEESEGQFPTAGGWMDAIENRISASDMAGTEANKKLVRPDLADHSGEYGYAINDKAAGKYKADAGAKTILIYESKQTGRNAHGDPAADREGIGITVDGTIVR